MCPSRSLRPAIMSNFEKIGKPVEVSQLQKLRTFFPRPFYPYPAAYDARIHGPYDPARTYGPASKWVG